MTRLPNLRDELVRAARRQDRRRRWLSWRALVAATAIALTVSGASLAATGTRVPILAGLMRGEDRLVPKNPAAARRIALDDQVLALLNRANADVFAAQPRCSPSVAPPGRARTTHAVPSPAVLRLVAALRRPATAADRRAAESRELRFVPGEIYADYVRRVTSAAGERFLVVVSRSTRAIFRPRPGCLDAQHDRLVVLLRHRSARLRSAALTQFSWLRQGQERNLRIPTEAQDTIALVQSGGGPTPVTEFATHGTFASRLVAGSRTELAGLVPDGVARVTFEYARSVSRGRNFKPTRYPTAYLRTVRVHDNVVTAHVPRPPQDAFPARMVWRDASGRTTRVVRAGGG